MSKVCNSTETLDTALSELSKAIDKLEDLQRKLYAEIGTASDEWNDKNYVTCAETVQNSGQKIASAMCRMAEVSEFITRLKTILEKMD